MLYGVHSTYMSYVKISMVTQHSYISFIFIVWNNSEVYAVLKCTEVFRNAMT